MHEHTHYNSSKIAHFTVTIRYSDRQENKKPDILDDIGLWWSLQGMILRPPDYESGATNQLS